MPLGQPHTVFGGYINNRTYSTSIAQYPDNLTKKHLILIGLVHRKLQRRRETLAFVISARQRRITSLHATITDTEQHSPVTITQSSIHTQQ